jgi:MFS family permease
MAGFAMSSNYALALVLLVAAGFLELSYSSMAQALVQLAAPDNMRGRVIGLFHMSAAGMRAFSGVSIGLVGAAIGIHWSLALSAMALLACILGLLAFMNRSRVAT